MTTTVRKWIPSPNYSNRGGTRVRLIVVHTTEGAQDIYSLGNWFGQASSQVSSHTGTDNKSATVIGEYVRRGDKAWTASGANPFAVQCEMCTPSGAAASWSRSYWLNSQSVMLDATALWVAEESKYFGIPIVALTPAQAQGAGNGVCQHSDLGMWGGGHHDCGPGFPMDELIRRAKVFAGETPAPEPSPLIAEDDMFSIPPKAVADRAYGISLDGAFSTMGVCVDSNAEGPTHLRAAFHTVSGGWQVIEVYTDPGHSKVVVTPKAKFDGVSLRRVDDSDVDVSPNFGR